MTKIGGPKSGQLVKAPVALSPGQGRRVRGGNLRGYGGRNFWELSQTSHEGMTRMLTDLNGRFNSTSGVFRKALVDAHEEMGRIVQQEALNNLQRTLQQRRTLVNNATLGRNIGIRAALQDPKSRYATASGWGVGSPLVFRKYKAYDYYRVIERGGGPVGWEMPGYLLDADLKLTYGPNTYKMKKAQQRIAEREGKLRAQLARIREAEKRGRIAIAGRSFDSEVQAYNRAIRNLKTDRADNALSRLGYNTKKRGADRLSRTGQPLQDWPQIRGGKAAAMAFVKVERGNAWKFVIKQRIRAKNYFRNAMTVMNAERVRNIYIQSFRTHGMDLPTVYSMRNNSPFGAVNPIFRNSDDPKISLYLPARLIVGDANGKVNLGPDRFR